MNTEVPSIINKELKEKTGKLDLSLCEIENIPKDVSKLTHLVSLNLALNQISKIENLETLTALNSLILYINIISNQRKCEAADKIKLDF